MLDTSHLQERYDYLNEEGFQAYGAVVTGPVKELLKLKELKEVRSVQLGEITYWNWND
ncbi:anti sigma factor C-terminal domain-containing protein [Psychrobacillus sp. L4]|uniref:anti sigma factor C-terminal domain-containing protein n=1 Tax=Psychrobacillus sp. L4 TaxID=3236892 RepID=UPI0036F366E3